MAARSVAGVGQGDGEALHRGGDLQPTAIDVRTIEAAMAHGASHAGDRGVATLRRADHALERGPQGVVRRVHRVAHGRISWSSSSRITIGSCSSRR